MKTRFNALWAMKVAVAVWSTCYSQGANPPPGANYSQGGFSGNGYAINPSGAGSVTIYTGTLFREVKDLEVFGGVGEHQLVFKRVYSSRYNTASTKYFGPKSARKDDAEKFSAKNSAGGGGLRTSVGILADFRGGWHRILAICSPREQTRPTTLRPGKF